jgi:hypothetical protein
MTDSLTTLLRSQQGFMIHTYAKPSPIRTVTVGFGISPNLSINQPMQNRPIKRLAGLANTTPIALTIPPVGNCTLPRRSLSIIMAHPNQQMQEHFPRRAYEIRVGKRAMNVRSCAIHCAKWG